ncbi:hypothetical protein L7F22_004699 [Adiantum nelumboides]|nr:hypothetical protein [Adiantum nelumboides]
MAPYPRQRDACRHAGLHVSGVRGSLDDLIERNSFRRMGTHNTETHSRRQRTCSCSWPTLTRCPRRRRSRSSRPARHRCRCTSSSKTTSTASNGPPTRAAGAPRSTLGPRRAQASATRTAQNGNEMLAASGWHCSYCFRTIAEFRTKMLAASHVERLLHRPNRASLTLSSTIQFKICKGEDCMGCCPRPTRGPSSSASGRAQSGTPT